MANNHKTLKELFDGIADAIRNKTGSTAKIKADNFPSAINAIESGSGGITPTGTITLIENGKHNVTSYEYAEVDVTPILTDGKFTPKKSTTTYFPDSDKDGYSSVTVYGDEDLIPANIKKNVEIFGVTGTLEEGSEPNLQTKTVTPKSASVTYIPDSSYDGFKTFTVEGDSDLVSANIKKGVTIFDVEGSLEEGTNLPTLTNPGSESDLAEGKELIDANGNKITGNVHDWKEGEIFTSNFSEVVYTNDKIRMSGTCGYPALMRTGAIQRIFAPAEEFGDAEPEQVLAGTYFTSKAGLKVRGTHTEPTVSFANGVLSIR